MDTQKLSIKCQKDILKKIAKEELNCETLHTRNADHLDFSSQAIWQIKKALERAFKAGVKSVKK